MIGVDLEHSREVFNTPVHLAQFLPRASSQVVGPRVRRIYFHELVAIGNGLFKQLLFDERARSNKQRFLMSGLGRQLPRAHSNQVVNIKSLFSK